VSLAPHPLTLRQLQYIVAVADRKSFRMAAEACHVAQPSLSAQLAQVEQVLGIQLFERDRRRVVLTAVGKAFVARARTLLIAADDLIESARGLADPWSGTLRIGVIPTIGPYLLPELAPVLRKKYPKLSLLWSEEKTVTLVEKLERAELDAAILALEADVGDLPHVILGKDTFVFAAAAKHPLSASTKPLDAGLLEGEQVLYLDDGHCFREQALSFCTKAGAEEADYRATSLATLVQVAASGHGVTLLPSLAVELENRRDTLRVRPFAEKAPARTIALVWRKNSALHETLSGIGETLRDSYLEFTRAKSTPGKKARISVARAGRRTASRSGTSS
jgi:LysR family hydrogen peroxide-inducible transcriptional activator